MNKMIITVCLKDSADFPTKFIPQLLDCVKEVVLTYDIGEDAVTNVNLVTETKRAFSSLSQRIGEPDDKE